MNDIPKALVLIDIQQTWTDPAWGERNNTDAEHKAAQLLTLWRKHSDPVFHVQHSSATPTSPLAAGQPGHELRSEVSPLAGEPVIIKSQNSAFIGTDLESRLHSAAISRVILCGLTTDHCVSTTARMANNLGFDTYVVDDACATFARQSWDGTWFDADTVHMVALASLHREFASILTTRELLTLRWSPVSQ